MVSTCRVTFGESQVALRSEIPRLSLQMGSAGWAEDCGSRSERMGTAVGVLGTDGLTWGRGGA